MRVDAHVHVWDLTARDQPWTADLPELQRSFSLADLAPALRRHAIDAVVLVQTVCVPAETPELLQLAARDPRVAGVVGWVDLCAEDVAERLAALRALPGGDALVGIRHQVQDERDPRWLCRAEVRRGLAAVGEAGLVYELVVRPAQLAAVLETVRALPALTFVLDHGAKPDVSVAPSAGWSAEIARLAECPNVFSKLSGLTSEARDEWSVRRLEPFGRTLLECFGPDRLMFGSDWPVCRLAGDYDAAVEVARAPLHSLSVRERAAVFGDTAVRVLGLGDGAAR